MAYQTLDIWTYREGVDLGVSPRNVVGYDVEARDGSIGKVDEATFDTDSSSLVVDTGPWIFGKKVMLPAGVIRSVDHADEKSLSTAPRTRSRTPRSSMTPCSRTAHIAISLAPTTGRAARASATGTTASRESRAGVSESGGRLSWPPAAMLVASGLHGSNRRAVPLYVPRNAPAVDRPKRSRPGHHCFKPETTFLLRRQVSGTCSTRVTTSPKRSTLAIVHVGARRRTMADPGLT